MHCTTMGEFFGTECQGVKRGNVATQIKCVCELTLEEAFSNHGEFTPLAWKWTSKGKPAPPLAGLTTFVT